MSVFRCQFCDKHVQFLATKFGKRLLFDAQLVVADAIGQRQGWMPGRWPLAGRDRVVLAPVTHYSRAAQAAVRRVLVLHDCPPHRAALQAAGLSTSENS